jgi:hypothetical protein
MTARRLIALLLATALLGALAAPAAPASDGPAATPAAKKGKKKCKKAKKGKKAGKKAKGCKRKGGPGAGPGSGLPGKPVEPEPPVDPVVSSVAVTPQIVLGGDGASVEVTLAQPAETGGQEVELLSNEPARVGVPAEVEVPEGETVGSFPATTTAGPTVTVPITAYVGASDASASLTVVDEPSLTNLTLARRCFPDVGLVDYGSNRVNLDVPAADPITVTLQSSDPTALAVPPSVLIEPDHSQEFFGVSTLMTSPEVTVTASYDGEASIATASVLDGSTERAIDSVSVFPQSVQPGAGATGTVTLGCEAGPGGATVVLGSSSPEVSVPASVFVPEDSLSATFPIATTMDADGTVTISATLGGTEQALLTIEQFGT